MIALKFNEETMCARVLNVFKDFESSTHDRTFRVILSQRWKLHYDQDVKCYVLEADDRDESFTVECPDKEHSFVSIKSMRRGQAVWGILLRLLISSASHFGFVLLSKTLLSGLMTDFCVCVNYKNIYYESVCITTVCCGHVHPSYKYLHPKMIESYTLRHHVLINRRSLLIPT